MVPLMNSLIWEAELVTCPSPKASNPHLDATITDVNKISVRMGYLLSTKNLIADVMLPYEVSQQLLIDSGLIHYLNPAYENFKLACKP